jgi:multicomponent Na+:H+ antiporter subunit F
MFEGYGIVAIVAGTVLLLLVIPALYRVVVGPTAIDRIVAVNIIGTKTAVLLVVIGVAFRRVEMFVDFALAYALLNYIGSIAAARYLHKSRPSADRGDARRAAENPAAPAIEP